MTNTAHQPKNNATDRLLWLHHLVWALDFANRSR